MQTSKSQQLAAGWCREAFNGGMLLCPKEGFVLLTSLACRLSHNLSSRIHTSSKEPSKLLSILPLLLSGILCMNAPCAHHGRAHCLAAFCCQ